MWVPHHTRDSVVDYVRYWKEKTEILVKRLLGWIGVPAGTCYQWKQRYGKVSEHNGWVPRDHWLLDTEKRAILDFYWEHPLDGYRRLTYMMLDRDIVAVSPASVYRVLKAADVMQRSNRKVSKKGTGFKQPKRVHGHWHIDVAYLSIGGTFYYLCSILDGYSRSIVHWEIRAAMTEHDVETILQRAREKFPGETPRIISDNGPQFVAKEFKQYVRLCGMTHVRTSPYYPQSNGKIERFHRTIKGECIRPGTPLTLEDARRIVGKYVVHYNQVRLHGALGYITPEDKLLGREQTIFDERDRKLEEARERRQRLRADSNRAEQKQTCYNDAARPEDKALLASNLSAASGPEARADGHTRSAPSSPLLLAQSDKRISETPSLVH